MKYNIPRDYKNERRVYLADLNIGDLISFGGKKPYRRVSVITNNYIMVEGNSTKFLLDNFAFKYELTYLINKEIKWKPHIVTQP